MTTYAPNYTPRYRARYLAAGIEHTIMIRAQRDTSAFTMAGKGAILRGLFQIFSDNLADDFAWLSAEYALTDSDDFIPTTPPASTSASAPVGGFTLMQRASSTNFNGRAVGSRAALYMYGIQWPTEIGDPAANGRISVGEDARVGTAAALLTANVWSNAGTLPAFHTYANYKLNDHLLKLLRRGTIS